jgi:hypothetical protein
MAKQTLLQIVQSILSDMDGDEVNSINDTIEATQVASVVREVHRAIVEEFDLQSTETLFRLDDPLSTARPTHMLVPSNIFDVTLVRYNKSDAVSATPPRYVEIPYVSRTEFLEAVSNRDPAQAEYQEATDPSGVVFIIRNNKHPDFYTTFDGGNTLVFDSFDVATHDTLHKNRTQCLGKLKNELALTDAATLDVPETLESLVTNEAREMCFELFKDGAPRKLIEATRRSKARAKERNNKLATPASTLPDYGRKRRG